MTTETKCRTELMESLIRLEQWSQRIQRRLKENPTDVVHYFPVEVLQKEATSILYNAGVINGCVMSRHEAPEKQTI